MKAFFLTALMFGAAAIAAHGQGTSRRTEDYDWKIAQRFDDGRVVIMLTSDDAPLPYEGRDSILGSKIERPLPVFLAKYLGNMTRADSGWGRRITGSTAKAGDRWAVDGGRAGWFSATIGDFVLGDSGCQEIAAVMATVDSNAAAFGRVKDKYFAARAVSGWTPPTGTTLVGPATYTVTEIERTNIEGLLQEAFRRESPKLLDKLGRDRHLPERQPWLNTYARVAAGAARIRFDVQAFRLTPDAFPRLYVRAVWNLDGQTVFMLGAWLRTAPVLDIESVDPHAARFPWLGLFERPVDPAMNGEVLNVVDVDRDGLAEVLMLYPYYEGFSLELSKYPLGVPEGTQVLAKFGGGC